MGHDAVGHGVVGHNVTGAKSLGQKVLGLDVLGQDDGHRFNQSHVSNSTVIYARQPANCDKLFSRSTGLCYGMKSPNQLGGNFFSLGNSLESPLKLGA